MGDDVLRKFKATSFTQLPGQAVYVPAGNPHQVVATEDSVSISFNYADLHYSNIPFKKIQKCCQCSNVGNDGKPILTIEDLGRLHETPKQYSLYNNNNPSQSKNKENTTLDTSCFKRFHDMYNMQLEDGELIL